VVPQGTFLSSGTFKGRAAVGRWFGDWFSTFDRDARFDVREITELEGGAILLVADHHARGRVSGAEVHGTVIWVYRLRGGKIVRVEGYSSRHDAVEAAAKRDRER
jgi:ketosteroid isomerase-like protein